MTYGLRRTSALRQLDQVPHKELHLSTAQNEKIGTLEVDMQSNTRSSTPPYRPLTEKLSCRVAVVDIS